MFWMAKWKFVSAFDILIILTYSDRLNVQHCYVNVILVGCRSMLHICNLLTANNFGFRIAQCTPTYILTMPAYDNFWKLIIFLYSGTSIIRLSKWINFTIFTPLDFRIHFLLFLGVAKHAGPASFI